jgi:hypothetical protein
VLDKFSALPEWRKMVVVFSCLFIVSAVTTLAVILSAGRNAESGLLSDDGGQQQVQAPIISPLDREIGSLDFMLPLEEELSSSSPYQLRPRVLRWNEEQVNRYWIPLQEIALDIIAKENDARIEEMFAEIP